jgi:hypothetical protein
MALDLARSRAARSHGPRAGSKERYPQPSQCLRDPRGGAWRRQRPFPTAPWTSRQVTRIDPMARRRPSRSGPSEEDRPTYLAKPFEEVAAVLDDRIAKGRELAQFDLIGIPQRGFVDELKAKFWSWHNYNATYLERAFTTKELHDNYEGGAFAFAVSGRETDLDRLRALGRDLRRDIDHLVGLRERLDLYLPPEEPAPVRSAPTAARPPRAPINVRFEGQVGQVNLAELIERVDARIEQVDQRGEGNLAEGLQRLTEAIRAASEADEEKREDALDAVAVLAEVGALPAPERGKLRGRVRGAVAVIKELVAVAPSVKRAWDALGPTIMEHLPRLGS